MFSTIHKPKTWLLLAVLSGSIALGTQTAQANSFWGQLNELFTQTYEDAQGVLNDLIADSFGNDAPYVQNAVNGALGELGLSDPSVIRDVITDEIGSDIFDLSLPPEVIQAETTIKEINRGRVRSQTASVLGQDGQRQIATKLEQISETITQTDDLAIVAEDADATQTVVKLMAAQQARTTQLIGGLQQEIINARIDNQFQLDVMADVSQTLSEEQNQRLQAELNLGSAALSQAAQISILGQGR